MFINNIFCYCLVLKVKNAFSIPTYRKKHMKVTRIPCLVPLLHIGCSVVVKMTAPGKLKQISFPFINIKLN